VLQGQVSKTTATAILHSNYSDVSDAMDDILSEDKGFIQFSYEDPKSHRHEKFYKITEGGLRALLDTDLCEEDFWSVMILLCLCSKNQISQDEFDKYYRQFQSSLLGYSTIHTYFLQLHFFDSILNLWKNDKNLNHSSDSIPVAQIVIECLAINGPMTQKQLAKKSSVKEEDIDKVINNYSVQNNLSKDSRYDTTGSDIGFQKIYLDFIVHSLIVAKKTSLGISYELSLFGVMLTMALVRYHYLGVDYDNPNLEKSEGRLNLFYNQIDAKKYCDKIVSNYRDKLPLIFGRWSFLKEQLGSTLLYDSFDFLFYKNTSSNSIAKSMWLRGNKEFYDDLQSLAYNTHSYLSLIYIAGNTVFENYQKKRNISADPKITPVDRKLKQIKEILKYADATSYLQELRSRNVLSFASTQEQWNSDTDEIKVIEDIFGDELTFLFYLNLNRISFSLNKDYRKHLSKTLESNISILKKISQELYRFGSPKQRLMAILTKDKEIKQWFSEWMQDIVNYRNYTSSKMSRFYDEISRPHENIRIKDPTKGPDHKHVRDIFHQEYDITKILSDIE